MGQQGLQDRGQGACATKMTRTAAPPPALRLMVTPLPLAPATASLFSPHRRETGAHILKACIQPPHPAAHSIPEVSSGLKGPLRVPPTIAPPVAPDRQTASPRGRWGSARQRRLHPP